MKEKTNFARLMEYAGKRKYFTYASWVLSAISAILALLPFYYIWKIIQEILEVAPNFSQAQSVIFNGWMAVVISLVSYLVYSAALICSHMAAFRVASNIRKETTEHIVKLPLGFADEFGTGKLRSIIFESSAATENYLAHQLPDFANVLATTLGLLFMLLFFDFKLGLLSLLPIILGFLLMKKMTGPDSKDNMMHYNDALEDMSNEAVEYVRGIPVVKTFGQTVFSFKKFKDSIDSYSTWVTKYTKDFRTPMLFYTAAINSIFVVLIGAGIYFTKGGVTTEFLLDLIFYIIITPIISVTLTKVMFLTKNNMIVADAIQRVDSILEIKPLDDKVTGEHITDASISLENVSYSYDGQKHALHDVSIEIPAGTTVGLVGSSGSGKSTMANIISRFFDPQSGVVKIGGVDVRNIEKQELMENISFVFQNTKLIKASILDNILMAKPNASEEEVMQALKAAQCSDIIEKLPNGIHTVIGSQGTYLSGGEQQRIAIARTMLKDSPIIILDEATAFADPDNEVKVQQAFANLSKGKTVVMIAHRLSTIVNADQIYVLKDGKVAEHGSSEELIAKDGIFNKMWNDYQSSANWKVREA